MCIAQHLYGRICIYELHEACRYVVYIYFIYECVYKYTYKYVRLLLYTLIYTYIYIPMCTEKTVIKIRLLSGDLKYVHTHANIRLFINIYIYIP